MFAVRCACLLALASCSGAHLPKWQAHFPKWDLVRSPSEIMVDVVNQLGLTILKVHNKNNENNIALSPYGVASILTVLLEGISGHASLEIYQCGGFPLDKDIIRIGTRDIHRLLRSYFIPEEGFLSGLSLSSKKVSLKREYQMILRFYGFDLTSFNTPIYPGVSTAAPRMNATTMDTTEMPTTTQTIDERFKPTTGEPAVTTTVTTTKTEPTVTETKTEPTVTTEKPTTITTDVPSTTPQQTTQQQTTQQPTTQQPTTQQPTTTQVTTQRQTTSEMVTDTTTETTQTTKTNEKDANLLNTSTQPGTTETRPDTTETQPGTTETRPDTTETRPATTETQPITTTAATEASTTEETTTQTEGPEENSTETLTTRSKRSYEDAIERYHDPSNGYYYDAPKTRYGFLVNGKYEERGVMFMSYDVVLPFYYVHDLRALALRFPLDSPWYYLLLVLPVDEHGIDRLVCDIGQTISLKKIVESMKPTYVRAVIPSFTLRGFVTLTSSLQKIGIRQIFEPRQTDFTPMTDDKDVYVTNIEQAITVTIKNYMDPIMAMKQKPAQPYQYPPVEFRATHPFLYFVMDSDIDVALAAGKIVNPINSRIQ